MEECSGPIERIRAWSERKEVLLSKLTDGTAIVVDLPSKKVHELNETSTFLLEAIRHGASSMSELRRALADRYGLDEETCASGVRTFLDGLTPFAG